MHRFIGNHLLFCKGYVMQIQQVLIPDDDNESSSFELENNEEVQERLIWQHLARKKMLGQNQMTHESKSEWEDN
jgi:hypothetical protein